MVHHLYNRQYHLPRLIGTDLGLQLTFLFNPSPRSLPLGLGGRRHPVRLLILAQQGSVFRNNNRTARINFRRHPGQQFPSPVCPPSTRQCTRPADCVLSSAVAANQAFAQSSHEESGCRICCHGAALSTLWDAFLNQAFYHHLHQPVPLKHLLRPSNRALARRPLGLDGLSLAIRTLALFGLTRWHIIQPIVRQTRHLPCHNIILRPGLTFRV